MNNLPKKGLLFFLVFLCLLLVAFLTYAYFWPTSPLNFKKNKPRQTRSISSEKKVSNQADLESAGVIPAEILEESCPRLFQAIKQMLKEKDTSQFSKLFSLIDVNNDKTIDYLDFKEIGGKIEDEKWCREILQKTQENK